MNAADYESLTVIETDRQREALLWLAVRYGSWQRLCRVGSCNVWHRQLWCWQHLTRTKLL